MALTRALPAATGSEVWIANLHASAGRSLRADAEQEVLRAAEYACRSAGDSPLILGGDLNLRPSETEIYGRLRDGFELARADRPGLTRPSARSRVGADRAADPVAARAARDLRPRSRGPALRSRSRRGDLRRGRRFGTNRCAPAAGMR